MKLSEQLREIKRLDLIRKKNEQMVPQEELLGRYRKPYEELLNDLSNRHKEAIDYCREVFRQALGYLESGITVYDYDELLMLLEEPYGTEDPFAKKILMAVHEALEDRDREEKTE